MINVGDMLIAAVSASTIFAMVTEGWTGAIAPRAAQTSDFFQVHDVAAVRDGQSAILTVDRTIAAEIEMGFVVRLMSVEGGDLVQFCKASSPPFTYRPDAKMRDERPDDPAAPVSLSWWTAGKCPVLPDGRALILTT